MKILAVAIGSLIVSLGITMILYRRDITNRKNVTNRNKNSDIKRDRAWIEVNMENLKHNAYTLQKLMPSKSELMAVVKANAYGHGSVEVSCCLNKIGIKSFAVATVDEGITLRKKGIRGDILILGYTDMSRVYQLIQYRLIQSVIDYEYAKELNTVKTLLQVHIKIDTGMHRLGINAMEEDKIADIFHFDMLKVSGIFTHLCVADSMDRGDVIYTKEQIKRFYQLLNQLEDKGIELPKVHIQSSYGLLNYPELNCDYVRTGIALYGSFSSMGDQTKLQPELHPVLTLKAKVILIREIPAGEGISYGRDFILQKDSKLAVLPIGYADGLPRNLSGEFRSVLLHGRRVPIVGRICMDQLLVDVTDVPEVKQGDVATLIGRDGTEEILATQIANNSGSITNELLSRLGSRIERIYV